MFMACINFGTCHDFNVVIRESEQCGGEVQRTHSASVNNELCKEEVDAIVGRLILMSTLLTGTIAASAGAAAVVVVDYKKKGG
jgi:hypothetical protein